MRKNGTEQNLTGQKLYLSVLLVLIALVSVTAATVAWFSIADNTRLHSMSMDVTSGPAIRIDLDAHAEVSQYKKTLSFNEIAERILAERGYDMREEPLNPVTTVDGVEFTRRSGSVVSADSGSYLEFTLHFIATRDVVVHLTSENSDGKTDGTLVSSKTQDTLPEAMRISFTADGETVIFDPGMGDNAQMSNGIRTFGLPDAKSMVYTDNNALFRLKQEVDKPVVVRIWLEGTDPACDNSLQGVDYSIRLRFESTDTDQEMR